MPIVHANGINIYYEIKGEGEPLLLISGTGGDHFFWVPHLEAFSKEYQVLTFDNRGIGQTDIPDSPYSIEMMADDIAALMDKLGIKKSHILGFSMGGAIAQMFALRHPEKVSKLILGGTFARMNPQVQLYLDAVLSTYQEGASPQRFYELILPWLFSSRYFEDKKNIEDMAYNPDDPYPQPLYGFKWQYLAQKAFDVTKKIADIKAKTLILAGEKDALAHVEDSQLIAQKIPNSILKVIPNSGHLFNYEERELFNQTVLNFLRNAK